MNGCPAKKFVIPNVGTKTFHLPNFHLESGNFSKYRVHLMSVIFKTLITILILLTANGLSPGGSGYNACA